MSPAHCAGLLAVVLAAVLSFACLAPALGVRAQQNARIRRDRKEVPAPPLDECRRDPIAYFAHVVRTGKAVEGMVSPEFNLDVVQIMEAARLSAASGKPVTLPLK